MSKVTDDARILVALHKGYEVQSIGTEPSGRGFRSTASSIRTADGATSPTPPAGAWPTPA
jgi:hypothetical protein